ncbi:hypothetical protein HU200_061880 [Digitaria exilis]|uniref:BTB domain-containing protein n=1 Tax=Digitaria exilis TaxID=1010633 RepID=A0A835A6A0_9POAL|nr:hypothetical protein HU200_061880 [Digitaria exilis]
MTNDGNTFAIVKAITRDVSVGGHRWKIHCYPRGSRAEDKGEYVTVSLSSPAADPMASSTYGIFEAFVTKPADNPSSSRAQRTAQQIYLPPSSSEDLKPTGLYYKLIKRSDLESLYVFDGQATITCGVIVLRDGDDPLHVPPSDIGAHLGVEGTAELSSRRPPCPPRSALRAPSPTLDRGKPAAPRVHDSCMPWLYKHDAADVLNVLLDSTDGSDVSFLVDGERFAAHRAVLAARSPVFKEQLMLGSTSKAKTTPSWSTTSRRRRSRPCSGSCTPTLVRRRTPPCEMLRCLLAAADRLKLVCAKKLWDSVSAETVAATLACAEACRCPELKTKCVSFLVDQKNFRDAVLTDGFVQLVQKFPGIVAELKEVAK